MVFENAVNEPMTEWTHKWGIRCDFSILGETEVFLWAKSRVKLDSIAYLYTTSANEVVSWKNGGYVSLGLKITSGVTDLALPSVFQFHPNHPNSIAMNIIKVFQ